jgi:hypothetical protein
MAQTKNSDKSDKLYAWNKHADATLEFIHMQMRLSTKLLSGKHSRSYLENLAQVTAKRGIPVVPMEDLTADDLYYMEDWELRNWRYLKEVNAQAVSKYETACDLVDDHFALAIADVESLFTIDSNARTYIKDAKLGMGAPPADGGPCVLKTHEEQYRANIAKLELEFKPSVNLDLFTANRMFETHTDANLTYTDFHAEHTRLYQLCGSLGAVPTDNVCETVLLEHFHNPSFTQEKKKMVMDRAKASPLVPRTYTWENFLWECATLCASNPEYDTWGLSKKEVMSVAVSGQIARYTAVSVSKSPEKAVTSGNQSSGGERTGSNACFRCALSGHKFWKCTNTTCSKCKCHIGTVPSDIRMETLDHDSRKCRPQSSTSASSKYSKPFDPKTAKKKVLLAMVKSCNTQLDSKRAMSGEADSAPAKKKKRKALRIKNGAPLNPHPAISEVDAESSEEE